MVFGIGSALSQNKFSSKYKDGKYPLGDSPKLPQLELKSTEFNQAHIQVYVYMTKGTKKAFH